MCDLRNRHCASHFAVIVCVNERTGTPTPGQGNDGYPKSDELTRLLSNCIESFKEMADYGAKVV
jgi:hypothetical protein